MATIRLALLGCGGIMHKHAGQSQKLAEVRIVGLCDPVRSHMQKLIDRSLTHLTDPPPMWDDPSPPNVAEMYRQTQADAVVIASPHMVHYEQVKGALECGLHVLVEKPMVTSLEQAMDVERRVNQSGKVLCIGYNTPCTVEFSTLRQIIRDRSLGALKVVNAYIAQPWMYATQNSWRQKPELSGGGMLYDSGAHVFNSIVWAVEDDVAEVHAYVDNCGSPVDVNGVVNIRFAGGVMAAVAVSGLSRDGCHASFMFEQGRIDIDPWSGAWMEIHRNTGGKVKYPTTVGKDGQPLTNFVDAILGRDEPRTNARHGVLQSQLMDAVYESARTGQPAKPRVN